MLREATTRLIREGIAVLLNRADREFLVRQTDKEAFAESLSWELANNGYCSQSEYEKIVLPYLKNELDYIDLLRQRAIAGEKVVPQDIGLFSPLLKEIGQEVRVLRKARGLTQEELAKAAGTFQPIVSRVERGETLKQPSLELLYRICKALGKKIKLLWVDDETTEKAVVSKKERVLKMSSGGERGGKSVHRVATGRERPQVHGSPHTKRKRSKTHR
jgi:transcriptional regulator with XRE-family HTH domain